MNWACMSVGKPGNGLVMMSAAFARAGPWQRMRSPDTVTTAPHSSSLESIADMWRGSAPTTVTSPPVIAAATSRVPASMRSGITRCRAPPSSGTPSISRRSVPAPSMRAPIAESSRARSVTSGSRAAFSMTVVPSASAAAIIRFSVPVTVTRSVVMCAPLSRLARAST